MKELLDKVGQYHLFNYLFPGIVFAALMKHFGVHDFLSDNLIVTAFLCYFMGMSISRVGSLIVGPVLRRAGFLKFKPYSEFIMASKTDAKLDVLSQENNTYRTITSMLLLVGLAKGVVWWSTKWAWLAKWEAYIIGVLLIGLFAFAYRKQTQIIAKRIEANQKDI